MSYPAANNPAVNNQSLLEAKLRLANGLKSGAGWFYWIAGLSLVNSLLVLTNATWGFIFGLAITQIVDVFAKKLATDLGALVNVAGMGMNIMITAVFVIFGIFANKRVKWCFILGMVLYALDGLLLLLAPDYLGLAFHAFALYCLFVGYKAIDKLAAVEAQLAQVQAQQAQAAPAATATPPGTPPISL